MYMSIFEWIYETKLLLTFIILFIILKIKNYLKFPLPVDNFIKSIKPLKDAASEGDSRCFNMSYKYRSTCNRLFCIDMYLQK